MQSGVWGWVFACFSAFAILLSALSRGHLYVWRGFLFAEIGSFYGPNMPPLAGLMNLVRTGYYNHVAPLELEEVLRGYYYNHAAQLELEEALLGYHHKQVAPLELNPALLCFHHQQITPLAQVGNPFMPSVHPIPAPLGAA